MPKIPFPNGVLDIKKVRILKTTPLEDGEKYLIALGCDQNLDYSAQLLPDILIKSLKKNGVAIPFYEQGGQQPNTVISDGDVIEFTACYGEPEPPPISIATHTPTDGFVAGVVKRVTITVNSHEFLTTTWALTMSNATFSIISSTTSQLVVDITATAAGDVIITDLVNNGYSITNKPYNLGTATIPPISIASHTPTDGFIVGVVKRLTITVNSNAFLTTTWTLSLNNATFSIISSTTSQLVVDITATAAGDVIISDLVNNGYSITNKPYNLGTATVQLYKGNWDGINDEITYSNAINAAIAAATNWTMEGWIKFDTLPNNNAWMAVCGSYNSTATRTGVSLAYDRRPYLGSNPNFYLGISSSTNVFYDYFRTELTAGVEYHVAYVKQGNELIFYLNGSLSGTATINYTILNSPELFKLGNAGNFEPSTYGGSRFDGQIYNFAISDVARHTANFTPAAPINDADTLLLFEPKNATNNIVLNTAVGGTAIGNGTLNGVNSPYTDFYKPR